MAHQKAVPAAILAISLLLFAGCSAPAQDKPDTGNSEADNAALDNANAANSDGTASDEPEGQKMEPTEVTLTPEDLEKADVAIEYGDYAAVEKAISSMKAGEMDGQVVEIDGISTNLSYGGAPVIAQEGSDGTMVGIPYLIEGAGESAYPCDGTRTKICAKVAKSDDGSTWVLRTLSGNVVQFG